MLFSIEKQWDVLKDTNTIHQKGPVLIQESKYTKVDLEYVGAQQKHLSPQQQADLAALLHKFPELFNGQLGHYPHWKIHLELLPEAEPVCRCSYVVAHAHCIVFLKELQQLCNMAS